MYIDYILYICTCIYIYIYIYIDLLLSNSYSNLTMVASLSSATRRKTMKVATVYNSDIIKMQNQKIQKNLTYQGLTKKYQE